MGSHYSFTMGSEIEIISVEELMREGKIMTAQNNAAGLWHSLHWPHSASEGQRWRSNCRLAVPPSSYLHSGIARLNKAAMVCSRCETEPDQESPLAPTYMAQASCRPAKVVDKPVQIRPEKD